MSAQMLSELENKVDSLIELVYNLKQEKEALSNELKTEKGRISTLEEEKQNLENELKTVRGSADEQTVQMESATEKIQNLLKKLETVE